MRALLRARTSPAWWSPRGSSRPPEMVAAAEEAAVPLLRTSHLSSTFIEQVQSYLEDVLTAQTSMHGVLLDVFGVGILLLGKSRHRQERDRARPGDARPPPGGRRHRRREAPLARGGLRRRLRDHQAPHGDPRPRHHQHQGPLRRRLDPRAQEDRDRDGAGGVGPERRVRPARRRGPQVPHPRRRDPHAGGPGPARPQHDHHHRGGGPQPPAQAAGPPLGARVPGAAQPGHRRSRPAPAPARWTSSDRRQPAGAAAVRSW